MIQETITLGPIHPALPGQMVLTLGMAGDRIAEVETEFGFSKRNILENMIGSPVGAAQLRFDRVDPECAFLLDDLFSQAVEKICDLKISDRAVWIREITSAICELGGFVRYLSKMSHRLGLPILNQVLLKHRESLLDLAELLTGSRYGYMYVVPGGLRYDLTEGFQERLEKWVVTFRQDFPRILALFQWTNPFHSRLSSLGRVIDKGSQGFISESSVESTRFGQISHVESRLKFALDQCLKINEELHELAAERHVGDFAVPLKPISKSKKVSVEMDTRRGIWRLTLELNPALEVVSVDIVTPSDAIVLALKEATEDDNYEDLPLVLESLNLSIPEIDR